MCSPSRARRGGAVGARLAAARVLGLGAALVAALAAGAAAAQSPGLERLGRAFTIPGGLAVEGVLFGGVSSLDRDPETGLFYALSDDRAEHGPTRLYELGLDISRRGITRVDLRRMAPIVDAEGRAAPALTLDPEALRLASGGGFFWANERDAETGGAPFIGRLAAPGADGVVRERVRFAPPERYRPRFDGARRTAGVRENLGFEALTFDAAGRLIAGLEGPLVGDGPAPSLEAGATARLLTLDPETGAPLAERLYPLDPIATAPIPSSGFALSGLVALLALPEPLGGGLLALERSFSQGQGHVAKIFHTRIESGEDVLGRETLIGARPMRKRLLYTILTGDRGPRRVFNIEAMALGPDVEGFATLVLASDDNFQPGQGTQFIAFRLRSPALAP